MNKWKIIDCRGQNLGSAHFLLTSHVYYDIITIQGGVVFMWLNKPEVKDNADYDKLKQEVAELSEKLSAIEKEAEKKEHDSHIVDTLDTYEYDEAINNIDLNYMDDGSVEFIYHTKVDYYPPKTTNTSIKVVLTKDEAYLIGEFLHEHNN
jgi:hypothetical protein